MDLNIFFGFKKEPRKGNFGDTAPPNHCFLIKNCIHDLTSQKIHLRGPITLLKSTLILSFYNLNPYLIRY